jgi:hypothetical protein
VKAPDWVIWMWMAAVVAFLVVSVVRTTGSRRDGELGGRHRGGRPEQRGISA